eukprot:1158691-Pelagomonas_calceolata.AAC.2
MEVRQSGKVLVWERGACLSREDVHGTVIDMQGITSTRFNTVDNTSQLQGSQGKKASVKTFDC